MMTLSYSIKHAAIGFLMHIRVQQIMNENKLLIALADNKSACTNYTGQIKVEEYL